MKERNRRVLLAVIVVVVGMIAGLPASAGPEDCTSDGAPLLTSGRFRNDTPSTVTATVKGDEKIGSTWYYHNQSVTSGQAAWQNDNVCDADFVKFNTAVRYVTATGTTIHPSGTCFKITGGTEMRVFVNGGQYQISYQSVASSSYCA